MLDLFDHTELIGRNCNGSRDKPAISREKLDTVRALTWKLYPQDVSSGNWKNCCTAIDEMLRRGNRRKKRYSKTLLQL